MTFFDDELEEMEDTELDISMLRDALIAELQSINQYQDIIAAMDNEEAIQVLERLRDDKKRHVAILMKLIGELDLTQGEEFSKGGL